MNMKSQAESHAEKFLRTYRHLFSARDMVKVFASAGVRASNKDAAAYLESSPLVFCLENNKYLTHAGAFTGELFSIKPSPHEYDQRVLVPGARCLPFVDGDMFSSALSFYAYGKKLEPKVGKFDSDEAIDMFLFFGEEYAPQYIAADPANANLDIADMDFGLPTNVQLTGIDLSPLIESHGFRKGDRLLCYVEDWDAGIIQVSVVNDGDNLFDRGREGEARLDWYDCLERGLLENFDKDGPCGTIEEQLAMVFFEHIEELCVPDCGSIEEYINRYAKKVGIEQFGVETRLWYKGQSVPAVGKWNAADLALEPTMHAVFSYEGENIYFSLQTHVLDQYILDMLYRQEDDIEALLARIYPEAYVFHRGEKAAAMLHLTQRNDILKSSYNWFADQQAGPIRTKALQLFKPVSAIMYQIDCCGGTLNSFPQQELVILSQLYNHLGRIFQSLTSEEELEADGKSIMISLDGMKWNFEDIEEPLLAAVNEQRYTKFKVVK